MELVYFISIVCVLIFLFNVHNWRKSALEYNHKRASIYALERSLQEQKNQLSAVDEYRLRTEKKINDEREKATREMQLQTDALNILASQKNQGFPYLAKAWDEFLSLIDRSNEYYLRHKKRPATTAADTIKEYAEERREAVRRAKISEYKLLYYETLFPWLPSYCEEGVDDAYIRVGPTNDTQTSDPAKFWIPDGEWEALSSSERNQIALNRYQSRKKTPWEIGRDYERYVGYRYEKDGCEVQYIGAVKGYDDLGRDLIAKKGGITRIIQCKYWADFKQIHEKHIFQLFGTCVEYALRSRQENNRGHMDLFGHDKLLDNIKPEFFTSTQLSERARDFASALGITAVENFRLENYPMIKCNIAYRNNEKIYHLPFDQQYDKIKIEIERGECYAMTIAEAEHLGFRRAHRWHPDAG